MMKKLHLDDRHGASGGKNKREVLFSVQYLRAFAAINVVVYHIIRGAAGYKMNVDHLKFFEGWGACGVDVFFVISGFVMYHTQFMKRAEPLKFFEARFLRVAPLYYLTTMAVVVASFVAPGAFRDFMVDWRFIWTSLSFVSLLINGHNPIIYVGWTLEWELLFYVIFAISLCFKRFATVVMACVAMLICTAFVSGNLIVLEFILGIIVGYVYHRAGVKLFLPWVSLVGGFLLLLVSLFHHPYIYQVDRFVLWGIPSAFILCGAVLLRQYRVGFMVFLGDASYSIYLAHVFVISIFYKFASKFLQGVNVDALAILCLGMSIVGGCVLYRIVEKPMTLWLRRRLEARRA